VSAHGAIEIPVIKSGLVGIDLPQHHRK